MKTLARFYLLALLVFLYMPILVMIAMGFNESQLYELPFRFSTRWYQSLADNTQLINSGVNSVWIALVTSIIATSLGTMASIALARRTFRGKSLLRKRPKRGSSRAFSLYGT